MMPAFIPTPQMRNAVESMVAFGLTEDEICKLVMNPRNQKPLSRATLGRKFKNELRMGLLRANTFAAGKLFELVRKGVPSAIFFWLKTRARWHERVDISVTHILTPEIIQAVKWDSFDDEELAAVEAGKLSDDLIRRLIASARAAPALSSSSA